MSSGRRTGRSSPSPDLFSQTTPAECGRDHRDGAPPEQLLPWLLWALAAPGAYCEQGYECKSGWCLNDTCTDVCQHDRDCASLPGSICRFFFGDWGFGEQMVTACGLPNYQGYMGESGDSCYGDYDCLRNNCTGSGRCSDPCHSSYDCPPGFVPLDADGDATPDLQFPLCLPR